MRSAIVTMSFTSIFVACGESDVFFHAELLLLLASIIISIKTSNSKAFFTSSGACLLTAIGTMVYELSRGWTARMINAETMATTVLSGMMLSTFGVALTSRMRSFVLYTHIAVIFGLCVCLTIGVCTVRMDLARPVDLEVRPLPAAGLDFVADFDKLDQSKLRAATFSAMHLLASILVVAETFRGRPCPRIIVTQACAENPAYGDRKICDLI